MMTQKEITKLNSLLQLVDDPDEEVYDTVASELLSYGRDVILPLENLWEASEDELAQKRIEQIIHSIHFGSLHTEWQEWAAADGSYLDLLILVARFRYPDLDEQSILKQYQKIRQNIWLELNEYLSPLEQINILNGFIYNYYRLSGKSLRSAKEPSFFINDVLEYKNGNVYTLGLLIAALCEDLDIPLKCLHFPEQMTLAYFETVSDFKAAPNELVLRIICYLDPITGNVYSQHDVEVYFKKTQSRVRAEYFIPLSKREVAFYFLADYRAWLANFESEERAEDIAKLMQLLYPEGEGPARQP